jgi:hypothetical protein
MNMMKFNNITFEFTTIDPYREVSSGNEFNIVDNNENNNQNRYCIESSNYEDFDYNYNLHIMEERYNILQFSNGIVDYLFPN